MSILDDFEEISFSDASTGNSEVNRFHTSTPKVLHQETIADKLNKIKSNPNTFDYENLLNQIKRPKQMASNSPPVVDRLLFDHQLSLNRKKFLKQQQDCEEIKSCTFRPKIKKDKKDRSFKDFYNQQQLFLSKKKEKIEKLREKIKGQLLDKEKAQTKRVQISPGSREILTKKEKRRNTKDETANPEQTALYNTVSLSHGIFQSSGKPPLPRSKLIHP
jgi:hypothetical protein